MAKRDNSAKNRSRQARSTTRSRQRNEAARLRAQQRSEAALLRANQKAANKRTRDLQKTARKRLNAIHKAQRTRAVSQRKAVRHRAAILKRKGLIRPEIDARKLVPSAPLRNLFKKFEKVLQEKETTYKVPEGKISDLKKQGYTVVDNRVVLQKGQFSRQGKVFTSKPIGSRTSEVRTVKLGARFETQIREEFTKLKPGEFIGFQIFGYNSYDIYQDADAMISKINEYLARQTPVKNIAILRIADVVKWREERAAEIAALEAERRERRRLHAAATRSFANGLRITRGH